MRRAGAALALAALLCVNAGPVVHVDAGAVRGEALGKGAAFRGIPFAAPPIGPLRWREARPVRAWRSIRDARAFGLACPQNAEGERPRLPQSEDCLNLNVVTPDLRARKLPVLVAIHGGAFAFGSNRTASDQALSPLLRRGVVLVTPNYRIGRFGFFAHPALTAEAGHGTGNFGLSDQILALDWVRRNIARFGGDPARVSILGCSAGGSSVYALMVSPRATGLFARASAHSGGGLFNANRTLALAKQQGVAFAERAGVRTLAHLRALTPAQVPAADPDPPDFGAIVDGYLLLSPLSVAFAQGKQAHVPYIAGSTGNEASIFGLMGFDGPMLKSRFGIDLAQWRPLYEASGPLSDAELLRRVQTDFLFTSASLGMAGLASRRAPAWSYHFDYLPPGQRGVAPGAAHCADMAYLFGPLPDSSAASRELAERWQDYWYNFIARGDPNGPGLPNWPQTRPGLIEPMVINGGFQAIPGFRTMVMKAWHTKWRNEFAITEDP